MIKIEIIITGKLQTNPVTGVPGVRIEAASRSCQERADHPKVALSEQKTADDIFTAIEAVGQKLMKDYKWGTLVKGPVSLTEMLGAHLREPGKGGEPL